MASSKHPSRHAPLPAASSSSSSSYFPPPPRTLVAPIKDFDTTMPNRQPAKLDVGSYQGDAEGLNDFNVVESYEAHLRQNPRRFMEQLLAAWNGAGWRGYTDYIGAPILEPGQSEKAAKEVLTSRNVQDRIRTLAKMRTETLYPQQTIDSQSSVERRKEFQRAKTRLRKQLEDQLTDVAAEQIRVSIGRLDSLPFLKFFAASVNNVLTRMYDRGIHINVPEVLELRKLAQIAAEKKQSIIFLPCHKSHIDYLTISWLLFRVGISLPAIVAGENLDLPVVGDVLRKGGAFFIRRTFSGDQLYPIVIREYIEHLLETGRNIECFIEGTRSRTGKLLPPKLGILKYIVEALQTGRTTDCWICPVSLQYDSVIESETYVTELLGKPKEQETLLGLLSGSSSLLSLKLGRIDVRFQKPWSLKNFIDEQNDRRNAQFKDPGGIRSPVDFANNNEQKTLLLKSLGYRVMGDVNRTSVVMPAALVGTILLTLRGRGVGRAALERRVDWLRGAIIAKGFQVADFGPMSVSEVVERALGLMKNLVEIQTDVMEETILPVKRFELSFYRNQVIHVFVEESILCATLYTKVKQGGTAPMQTMTRSEILQETAFISGILRNEFIYATASAETNVTRTLAALIKSQVLEETNGGGGGREDEETRIGLHRSERERGRDTFDSYLFLVWPFIESYWAACCSLLLLAPPREQQKRPLQGGDGREGQREILWFAAKDFEKKAQLYSKTLYQQGEIAYLEAINAATLSQAFGRMEELGLVLRRKSDSVKPIPLIAISPEYTPLYSFPSPTSSSSSASSSSSGPSLPTQRAGSQPRLWDFLEHLSSFRREGKERREVSASNEKVIMRHVLSDESTVVERSLCWVDADGFRIEGHDGRGEMTRKADGQKGQASSTSSSSSSRL